MKKISYVGFFISVYFFPYLFRKQMERIKPLTNTQCLKII